VDAPVLWEAFGGARPVTLFCPSILGNPLRPESAPGVNGSDTVL